jgi:membrane-associated phospholipid phosphatase
MQLRTVPHAAPPAAGPPGLLPVSLRAAAGLLAGCVLTAVLAFFLAGTRSPGALDAAVDPRIQAVLGHVPVLLEWLPKFGTPAPAALMTAALALIFAASRRWSGIALAVIAVPVASGLTEYLLKPSVGALLDQGFPSGHATVMFALATIWALWLAGPARSWLPGALRLLLALLGALLAAAVGAAMIAIQAHTLTDVVAGTAVGTGVVLACALSLDLVISWIHASRLRSSRLRSS